MQPQKVFIHIPHSVPRQMVRQYLKRTSNSVQALKEALDRCDYDYLRVFGHRLSGTGGAYGFPALTEMGAAMEHTASERHGGELKIQVAALEAYLGRVEILPE